MGTMFSEVYNRFLGNITDDLYVVYTPMDTIRDCQDILIHILPDFEFPRFNLYDYEIKMETRNKEDVSTKDFYYPDLDNENQVIVDISSFNTNITPEEINILAVLMMIQWLQRQITSIELIFSN